MLRDIFRIRCSRRKFFKLSLMSFAGIVFSPVILDAAQGLARAQGSGGKGFIRKREAMFFEVVDPTTVRCLLCPRGCVLKDGMRGFCRVREPENGKLYSFVYGNPTAVHVDPIEKKPLYHFLPGTMSFSIATAGCNFRCKYCQNWEISQFPPEETVNIDLPPERVADRAIQSGCATIAYTYTDPSIYYEYMVDTSKFARARGIRNIYRSNGSLNSDPIEELSRHIDAANIDLKGFTQEFYSKIPEGYLDVVLENIKRLRKGGVHVEITNLIIPTLNDDPDTLRKMCRWIRDEVGADTPVHFSRFYPLFQLKNLPPTPVRTLEEARAIAREEGLLYAYVGNIPGHEGNHTYCPRDGKVLIRRQGYSILENNLKDGACKFCGYPVYGVWS